MRRNRLKTAFMGQWIGGLHGWDESTRSDRPVVGGDVLDGARAADDGYPVAGVLCSAGVSGHHDFRGRSGSSIYLLRMRNPRVGCEDRRGVAVRRVRRLIGRILRALFRRRDLRRPRRVKACRHRTYVYGSLGEHITIRRCPDCSHRQFQVRGELEWHDTKETA